VAVRREQGRSHLSVGVKSLSKPAGPAGLRRKGVAALENKITEVLFEGETVPAEQLDFEADKEPWCVYRLSDGTVLRLKSILGNVCRLVDRYKPDGEPIYVFGIAGVSMAEVPPALKQPQAAQKTRKQ